ncbi:MAG: hypothetical protein Q7S11_02630 [bacterium]|nr:hypothetical protein [bacterium]
MNVKKITGKKIGLGVGLVTAAALAGAAGLYLYGKDGAKNRKKVKTLAVKVHTDVVSHAKKLKSLGKKDYLAVVDMVTKKYNALKSIDKNELNKVAINLKKHWNTIEREAKKQVGKVSQNKKNAK